MERYNSARQEFYKRRSKYYSELDEQHANNKQKKQTLISEARSIAQFSTEWKSSGERLNELMDKWINGKRSVAQERIMMIVCGKSLTQLVRHFTIEGVFTMQNRTDSFKIMQTEKAGLFKKRLQFPLAAIIPLKAQNE